MGRSYHLRVNLLSFVLSLRRGLVKNFDAINVREILIGQSYNSQAIANHRSRVMGESKKFVAP